MTELLRLPIASPLQGLRLHSARAAAGAQLPAKVTWLLGLGEAQQRRDAEHRAVLQIAQSLQRAVAGLPGAVNARLDQVAALAVELGLAVAREVVGDALDRGHVDPTPVVVRCLREAVHGSDRADLVVRLHPDDLAPVMDRIARDPSLQAQLADATLQPDPGMARGAVRAETGAGALRWDPRETLERVAGEIRREAGGR